MKHGYLWRGIAATTALGIILLPGSFVVRADGQGGERKNVRGDGNPDESRQLLPTTRADRPDIPAAEGGVQEPHTSVPVPLRGDRARVRAA